VLDPDGNLQPIGVPGELCLYGRGLAQGYLNRPELTLERFVPCHKEIDAPIYKTGDRARFLPDGTIDFLGRLDHQVKIRGFRVELGEIEACLLDHPAVQEAVVLMLDTPSGDSILAAFITGDGAEDLEDHMRRRLPSYMIPSRVIGLESLPLNQSGKIDRSALAGLERDMSTSEKEPPQTETQRQLVAIWASVLDIPAESIGINDNFFQLGGHSLTAALTATRVQKALGITLPPAQLFDTPTIRSLGRAVTSRTTQRFTPLEAAEKREFYPLSPAQKRLFILQQLDPASTSYNMPDLFVVNGEAVLEKIEAALAALMARHDSFRTSFHTIDGAPAQIIHPTVHFQLEHTTVEDFIRPFDLRRPPLIRLGATVSPEGETLLMLDTHHIICDGVSTSLILNDLAAFVSGDDPGPQPMQYKDFVLWQRAFSESPECRRSEVYWLEQFSDGAPQLNLPLDNPRPPVFDPSGLRVTTTLRPSLTTALMDLGRRHRTTMFQTLLALYFVLLSRLCRQEDIVAGTPVSGRIHPDSHAIVGMFVNTLVLRANVNGDVPFEDFLAEVKRSVQQGIRHQSMQFEDLVERLAVQRDPSRNPLFDAMFALQEDEFEPSGHWCLSPYEAVNPPVKCDLALIATREKGEVRLRFEFASALFEIDTVNRFAAYFQNLAKGATADSSSPCAALDMIPQQEKTLLLETFNRTATDYPPDQTLHRLVFRQAGATPDNVAVCHTWNGEALTYGELEKRAQDLGAQMRRQGVAPREIVALVAEPSFDMVVGMLAIMTAGCAYLPIDTDSPAQRITRLLSDSGARWILTQNHLQPVDSRLPIDTLQGEADVQPDDAAYIIYTSGSTGAAKGVVIQHRSIVNMILWAKNYYRFTRRDVVLQLASIAFDASVEEIFTPLAAGARLALLQPRHRLDIRRLRHMLENIPVTRFTIVPSLYRNYLEDLCPFLPHLRSVTLCGESCGPRLVRRHFELLPEVELFNGYGPSESSVCATVYPFDPADPQILVGGPIANVRCYVLDQNGYPVPIGMAGQLCVAGAGLAAGYLNRPELTAQSFGYYSPEIESPVYRTGDLARWKPDGNLEFLGRIDRQVKIRGFRVELGEIEVRLMKYPSVSQAAVAVCRIPTPELCAWVASNDGTLIDESLLQNFLAEELPHYMVPSYIQTIEEFPFTPSGKVDGQTLRAQFPPRPKRRTTFVEPKSELESRVAAIWREVLPVESVGLRDNFFAMGGNSLKVMELAKRLEAVLERPVPAVELFRHQTISAFIGHLDAVGASPKNEDSEERRMMKERAHRRRDVQKNRRRRH
jgi:amino acid adenylation domain-containing protein